MQDNVDIEFTYDKQCVLTVNNLIGNTAVSFCLFGEKQKNCGLLK